jgi:HAD superfamily hydrolase (TIGR01450 family)
MSVDTTDRLQRQDQADAVRTVVAADGWMLDVDGCLARTAKAGGVGGTAMPGAVELLAWLRRHGRSFVVCTNASQRPVRDYARHLREIGLDIADDEMMTAATAAADHIAREHLNKGVLVVGDRGLDEALRERGITPVTGASGPGAGAGIGVVVVGAADTYTAAALNAACLAIADHGAAFYVTVDAPWFHGGVGRSVASSSAMAAAITAVTGQRPVVCGKPSPTIANVLRTKLGGASKRLVVVGDMASIEIRLAHQMGALGVLVMSGGTSLADLPGLPPEHQPHLQVDDVGALVQHMKAIAP